jgi:hypothetical protein
MASWVAVVRKVTAESTLAKVALLIGEPTPVTYLEQQITGRFDRTLFLTPPVTADDLGKVIGLPTESQATVITGVGQVDADGWDLLAAYLAPPKVPAATLVLTGETLPDHPGVAKVKSQAGRGRNVYAQVISPAGAKGREELITWLAETWNIYEADADYACARADFDLTALVWATKVFLALSDGQPVAGQQARKMIDIAVPKSLLTDVYTEILHRSPDAVTKARDLIPQETLDLLRWLERTLFDLDLLRPLAARREPLRRICAESGLHAGRVAELRPLLGLYTLDTASRCRTALAVAFQHWMEPECAETLALLWT